AYSINGELEGTGAGRRFRAAAFPIGIDTELIGTFGGGRVLDQRRAGRHRGGAPLPCGGFPDRHRHRADRH
ncbi:hypothetical protein C7E25_25060, partial [Stenotrophomonas maltophilia]